MIIAILIVLAIVIAFTIIQKQINEDNEIEEAQKNNQEKQKNTSTSENANYCIICGKDTQEKIICDSCWNDFKELSTKIPERIAENQQELREYHLELIKNILLFQNHSERIQNSLMLYAVDEILFIKYKDKEYIKHTRSFLQDFYDSNFSYTEEIIKNYFYVQAPQESNIEENKENTNQNKTSDLQENTTIKPLCAICEENSSGNIICDNCWNRVDNIQKDIPSSKKSSYEELYKYYSELKKEIIFFNTHHERELNSIKLLAISDILKDKYSDKKPIKEAQYFLDDFYELNYISNEEFIKTHLEINKKFSAEEKKSNKTKNYIANYRCDDGHFVRSKSEREIDNFFFNNNILHIYESKYHDPNSDKTFTPDFYLPVYNLYIEYFGLNTPKYNKIREEKIRIYKANPNINFEYLDYTDDFNITEKLQHICRKHNIPVKY